MENYIYQPEIEDEEVIEKFEPVASTSLEDLDLIDNNPPYSSGINPRLIEMSKEENLKNLEELEKNKIGNLTINNFFKKVADSLLGIFNDLINYNTGNSSIIEILTKDFRLMSIGIVLILLSLFLSLLQNII